MRAIASRLARSRAPSMRMSMTVFRRDLRRRASPLPRVVPGLQVNQFHRCNSTGGRAIPRTAAAGRPDRQLLDFPESDKVARMPKRRPPAPRPSKSKPIGTVPTRERILDEVERLIAVRGVYGFTLHDVIVPLRMRVPAIYKHYRNRDDVLIELARRFVNRLATQFPISPGTDPIVALRLALDQFVVFKLSNPAYVRLALADFATPGGGMEYVKLAAGGSFEDNFSSGPLAPMYRRLAMLLSAAARTGRMRRIDPTDFYRIIKATLLFRLVFPDDALLLKPCTPRQIAAVQRWLWALAVRLLAPAVRGTKQPDRPRQVRRAARRTTP
jgi:AcrR family transcriptional regulator